MTYGRLLERRKNGTFYFRQVYQYNGKQIAKRISLKTSDITVARFLALQFKARIEMIDFNNVKKFDVSYDDNGNIKSVNVKSESDAQNLQEFLKLQEIHKAEAHKRDIEKLKLQQEFDKKITDKKKEEFLKSEKGELYQKLEAKLIHKEKLTQLKDAYIAELEVTENTKYKYNLFIGKFITYANSLNVFDLSGIDRKLVYAYLLYLRNFEHKSDSTIKNIFNNLSSFFNHLIRTGEAINQVNPFVGHKLKDDKDDKNRLPFTNDELQNIFSSDKLQSNKKLFFVCLLLVTTGARPNEICQLWTDDIYIDNGIYKIRIVENSNRDQTLKTKSSERVIYLNSILEEFNFTEYLKSKKLGMIFELKKPAQKTYSTFISQDFTELLRSIGIEKKTMYCFRHTVIDRLKQSLVLKSINEDLVGHEGQGTNAKVYSQQHSAENLKKETEEILKYREIEYFKQALGVNV